MNKEKEEKNTEISARVTKVIEFLGETSNSFAIKLGYKRAQTIYDIQNMKSAPSYDFFHRFSIAGFSAKINLDWLLTGNGQMQKEGLMSDHPPGDTMLYNMYKESLDKIEKQAQEIGALRKENQLLEKENSILKARVAMDARDANTAIAENASA